MGSSFAAARRWLWRLGIAGLLLTIIVIGAFGILQTPIGRDWLGRALIHAASGPGASVMVEGLDGLMPFHMTARRIAIADERGVWLALSNVAFDLSPRELFAGRARIHLLSGAGPGLVRRPDPP